MPELSPSAPKLSGVSSYTCSQSCPIQLRRERLSVYQSFTSPGSDGTNRKSGSPVLSAPRHTERQSKAANVLFEQRLSSLHRTGCKSPVESGYGNLGILSDAESRSLRCRTHRHKRPVTPFPGSTPPLRSTRQCQKWMARAPVAATILFVSDGRTSLAGHSSLCRTQPRASRTVFVPRAMAMVEHPVAPGRRRRPPGSRRPDARARAGLVGIFGRAVGS